MMEIVTWNIPLSNGKTENSLLGVWFWGSVSHFRSRPFKTTTKRIITIKSNYFIQNNTTEQMQNSNTEKSQRVHNKTYKKY